MTAQEKKLALKLWMLKWDKFLDDVLHKYKYDVYQNKKNINIL